VKEMPDEQNDFNDFSLESILAEIKGTAFINGDKKTPPDILEDKADRILREAAEKMSSTPEPTYAPEYAPSAFEHIPPGMAPPTVDFMPPPAEYTHPQSDFMPPPAEYTHPPVDFMPPPAEYIHPPADFRPPSTDYMPPPAEYIPPPADFRPPPADYIPPAAYQQYDRDVFQAGSEPDFSDTGELPVFITPPEDEAPPSQAYIPVSPPFGASVTPPFGATESSSFSAAMNAAQTAPPDTGESPTIVIPKAGSDRSSPPSDRSDGNVPPVLYYDQYNTQADGQTSQQTAEHTGSRLFDYDTFADEQQAAYDPEEEEVYEEPRLRDAGIRFAKACNSISLRCVPASIITLLMVIMTYVYEGGLVVPFGIGYNLNYAAGVLVICLLIVMMLCVDIIVRGVDFLRRGAPNAETLILFSCAFSLISAVFTMLSGTALMLPFCAVSALSLTLASYGERFHLRALTDTLKTAVGSSEPYGVQAEYNREIDKSVLKKTFERTDGFYSNLMQPDIIEILYNRAAPVLLIAALLLTVITVLVNGGVENSLHILSALLAAAAPFSLLFSFSVPFSTVSKSIRKSGAALAGWGGADDICFTDGVCVTDDDLFPPGTLRLSGVKVYDGASPDRAILYTASLIIKSGSGLTSLFSEVLKQQGMSMTRVENFECHESGIGAIIRGEQIATGSAAFMNLLGVRVPDDTSMKNAVYTAVNNKLVAMFAIDYKPLPSVQSALIAMLKWRIDLFFAMRDFNITPSMVGQKFKVPFESFVFIPAKDSYSISDPYSAKQGRMASVLIREGLGPFAESITGGRLLKSASFFATILSIVSAALGIIIMFLMCWSGSFISASPGNLVIFMLCMLVTVLIVCGYVRLRK